MNFLYLNPIFLLGFIISFIILVFILKLNFFLHVFSKFIYFKFFLQSFIFQDLKKNSKNQIFLFNSVFNLCYQFMINFKYSYKSMMIILLYLEYHFFIRYYLYY